MRFCNVTHKYYCGIDLHARNMYTCVLDQQGNILLHRDLPTDPDVFLKAIAPFRRRPGSTMSVKYDMSVPRMIDSIR